MLTSLAIRHIGVIDDATLDFGPGFTAITGETGAGKTMVVTGLSLLLGHRLDKRRAGVSSTVEGRLSVTGASDLTARLDELGAETDDGEVLVVRRVTKDGRSRSHIGGVPIPISTLAALVGENITIHGQSDQIRLRDPGLQREALDATAGEQIQQVLAEHRRVFRQRSADTVELQRITDLLRDRDTREQELSGILTALEQADPQPNEDEELRAEIQRLSDAADSTQALNDALMHLVGDENASALTRIDAALAAFTGRNTFAHGTPADAVDRLTAAREELSDIAGQLSGAMDETAVSPERIEEANQRLHDLTVLIREIGPRLGGAGTVSELLERSQLAVQELDDLEGAAEKQQQLTEQIHEQNEQLEKLAAQLTEHRTTAAQRLADRVEQELAGLEMPGARIRIAVNSGPEREHGRDTVEFLLQPHRNAEFMPLAAGASGGELSRIMLALEVALVADRSDRADGLGHPVFIFDEIDAGIGGRAARAVGERLADLACEAQVIVVTHLPQVASYATTHLSIVKESDGDQTVSHVETLDEAGRVAELARMLAGDDSEAARTHAAELLADSAARTAAGPRPGGRS